MKRQNMDFTKLTNKIHKIIIGIQKGRQSHCLTRSTVLKKYSAVWKGMILCKRRSPFLEKHRSKNIEAYIFGIRLWGKEGEGPCTAKNMIVLTQREKKQWVLSIYWY